MGYRPPKGIRPPQLEGKRSGRPKGSKSHAQVWRDALWGYEHRHEEYADYPNQSARLWWSFSQRYPDEVEEFLGLYGKI